LVEEKYDVILLVQLFYEPPAMSKKNSNFFDHFLLKKDLIDNWLNVMSVRLSLSLCRTDSKAIALPFNFLAIKNSHIFSHDLKISA
jgi:hypothetical protein